MANQRYSAEQWQQFIEQQATNGQSQETFCVTQGLALSTFRRWKTRLCTQPAESSPNPMALFAPLLGTSEASDCGNGWDIELDLGHGICLRMRRGA